jgi:hypothetical protein
MRLFEATSFYVQLIIETMYDIRYFLIMFIICLASFANAILILDLAEVNKGDNGYERLIPGYTENNLFDSMFNSYLTGLGEFSMDTYPTTGTMIWIYFIAATVLTNMNFLNTLISIIGDTYARIT